MLTLFVEMIMIMMEMVIMVIGDFFRGVGVIAYMLVSGGVSPFWAGNRYRTMAKVITLILSMILVIIRIDIIIIVDKIKPRYVRNII